MHRIDAESATADHLFTDGSPTGGVPATIVPSTWLNDLQENIMAVLEEADIPGTKGDAQDLVNAIKELISGSVTPFNPVEQGGGPGQTTTKLNIGAASVGSTVKLAVDGVDKGDLAFLADLIAFLPKRVFAGNDYIRIPDVPGGWIVQWADGVDATLAAGGIATQNISLPIQYPNALRLAFVTTKYGSGVTVTASEAPTGTTTSLVAVSVHNPVATGSGTSRPRVLTIGN